MRWPMLPAGALLLAAGCTAVEPLYGPVAAVQVAATAVLGRGPVEAVYSLATGRDCSLANYAAERRFCAQEEMPRPPAYCTRSLGVVDCWEVREPYSPQAGVGQTPTPPPVRDRRWVDLRGPERRAAEARAAEAGAAEAGASETLSQ